MEQEILELRKKIEEKVKLIRKTEDLESFRLEYLVRKGAVQSFFDRMKEAPKERKAAIGKILNELRNYSENVYKELKERYEQTSQASPDIDLTLPGKRNFIGAAHPVNQIMQEMVDIFNSMGFSVAEGPDIEDGYHNFDALNFPPDHPARDMQDSFFIESKNNALLRTHSSPVQIRLMKAQKPPIRSIMPARVYRNEAISARSLAEFHQIEGLYINKGVTFAELKGTVIAFAKKMYGEQSKFRFRPSFFPFTEPSAEMDISCFLCGGRGCRICKHSGWLEVVGCGMVHPNVLKECDIDPEIYTGYAFGFGIERVALLKTGIDDIRLFYQNDVRVLEQF